MLTLTLQVPQSRDRAAIATLRDGKEIVASGHAAASATATIAAAHGNPACDPLRPWGHPPAGTYQLLNHRPTTKEQAAEYGMHLLVFEPRSGQASDAEPYGRLALLVYGGPTGRDRRLRRTQGGVRVSDEMLSAAVGRLKSGVAMTLEIAGWRAPSWWQFWKPRIATPALSATTPAVLKPPLDELSIMHHLLQGVPRQRLQRRTHDDSDTRDDRGSDASDSRGTREHDTFRGGGGESAGAGASGSWDSVPAGARGVDSAGRVIAGAAAGAMLGAAMAQAATDGPDPGTSAGSDTHTNY